MIHDRMADRLTVRHFLEVIADLYLPRQLKSQRFSQRFAQPETFQPGEVEDTLRIEIYTM